jgi:choline dehydrogenase-like flavoprotein
VFRGAVATRLLGTPGDRHVERLRFDTLGGATFFVKARAYVLCAGGLENARLMLASRDNVPLGFANHHDSLGRYYMNHPHNEGLARLHLAPGHPDVSTLLERLDRRHDAGLGTIVQFGLGLDEDFARRHRLLNGCSFIYARLAGALRPAADAVNDLRRELARGRPSRDTLCVAGRLLSNAPGLLEAAHHRMRSRALPIEHHVVVDQLEQVPDRDSRVTLGDRLDAFGVSILRLDWRVGSETTETLRALHRSIARVFSGRGWGTLESPLLESPTLVPDYTDAAHPSGTTRMSVDARTGVVDRNARVHGVDNLFVCGSSIFSTAGHAAPTLTIIALALRLAQHARTELDLLGSG